MDSLLKSYDTVEMVAPGISSTWNKAIGVRNGQSYFLRWCDKCDLSLVRWYNYLVKLKPDLCPRVNSVSGVAGKILFVEEEFIVPRMKDLQIGEISLVCDKIKSLHESLENFIQTGGKEFRSEYERFTIGRVYRREIDTFEGYELEEEAIERITALIKKDEHLIHGDPHPGNILLGEQDIYIVDFEDLCLAPRVVDYMGFVARSVAKKRERKLILEAKEEILRRNADYCMEEILYIYKVWLCRSRSLALRRLKGEELRQELDKYQLIWKNIKSIGLVD